MHLKHFTKVLVQLLTVTNENLSGKDEKMQMETLQWNSWFA